MPAADPAGDAWREEALGEEHSDTLTSAGDLAASLARQVRYVEAREMLQASLERRVLGDAHRSSLHGGWRSCGRRCAASCRLGQAARLQRGALADFKFRAPAWPRFRARGDSDSPSSRQLWLFRFAFRARVLGTGSHGWPGPCVAPTHVERLGLLCQLLKSAPPLSGSTWRQKNSGRVGSCWPPSALRNSGPGRSRARHFRRQDRSIRELSLDQIKAMSIKVQPTKPSIKRRLCGL